VLKEKLNLLVHIYSTMRARGPTVRSADRMNCA